jgi:hypothetical protein
VKHVIGVKISHAKNMKVVPTQNDMRYIAEEKSSVNIHKPPGVEAAASPCTLIATVIGVFIYFYPSYVIFKIILLHYKDNISNRRRI